MTPVNQKNSMSFVSFKSYIFIIKPKKVYNLANKFPYNQ